MAGVQEERTWWHLLTSAVFTLLAIDLTGLAGYSLMQTPHAWPHPVSSRKTDSQAPLRAFWGCGQALRSRSLNLPEELTGPSKAMAWEPAHHSQPRPAIHLLCTSPWEGQPGSEGGWELQWLHLFSLPVLGKSCALCKWLAACLEKLFFGFFWRYEGLNLRLHTC